MATKNEKARVWVAVGYTENMRDDWQDVIGDALDGLPCAYCVHDKDEDSKSEHRKDHAHFMIAFSNTTTYNHALKAFRRLDKSEDKTAFNTAKPCLNARGAYDYLIHDTETARKQGKHLYDKSERIEVNNFDIGEYEQFTKESKHALYEEMCDFIIDNQIKTMDVFYRRYRPMRDSRRAEVYMTYMSQLDRMTTAVWKRCRQEAFEQESRWGFGWRSDASEAAVETPVAAGGSTTTPPAVTEDGRQEITDAQLDEVTSQKLDLDAPVVPLSISEESCADWFTKWCMPGGGVYEVRNDSCSWLCDGWGIPLIARENRKARAEAADYMEAWAAGDVTPPVLTEAQHAVLSGWGKIAKAAYDEQQWAALIAEAEERKDKDKDKDRDSQEDSRTTEDGDGSHGERDTSDGVPPAPRG